MIPNRYAPGNYSVAQPAHGRFICGRGHHRPEEARVSTTIAASPGATRPAASEYLPYYERYIALVPDGDVISTLATQMTETQALLQALPASVATYS
jgi:hypothetical protein